MPEKFVAVVEPNGVGAQQPAHSFHQIRLRRFCDEMKMVSHQTIGMNLPGSFRASFGQSFQEIVAVNVRQKDVFATIPAAHQVVSGAWKLHSWLSGHQLLENRSRQKRKGWIHRIYHLTV
jgi:hypothetical protein